MKIVKAMAGGVLLAVAPFLAHADDMSYRYFQAGYVEFEEDATGIDETADGFGARGSFGFLDNYFVFTEFNSVEASLTGANDLEVEQLNIGLGTHWPINDTLDFVARAGSTQLDLEVTGPGGGQADLEGYLVGAGVRGQLGDAFQYEVGAVYQDLDSEPAIGFEGGSETGFELAIRYHFTQRWAAAIEYQDIDPFTQIFAGVRVSF